MLDRRRQFCKQLCSPNRTLDTPANIEELSRHSFGQAWTIASISHPSTDWNFLYGGEFSGPFKRREHSFPKLVGARDDGADSADAGRVW